jgi:hypothetical protein
LLNIGTRRKARSEPVRLHERMRADA